MLRDFLSLPISYNKRGRILHITDTHLFADDNDTLLGINTNASFNAVMDVIEDKQQNYDLIVATGDFVQDGSVRAYQRFAARISELTIPCVWLPGNHDNAGHMSRVFDAYRLPAEKLVLFGEQWAIILLNSQVSGSAYGYLSQEQLDFLSTSISRYPERHILVLLHHHPVNSGCQWLDQHCLKNAQELKSLLAQHPQVKAVGCGHIHQEIDQYWQQCRIFSTPSTCVQFKPKCDSFTLEERAPGWRELCLLSDGQIETAVCHLEEMMFLPDMSINGY